MTTTYKAYDAAIDSIVEGERAVVATVTTDAVDRDGEIVLPAGGDLTAYRKNPVVLWLHGRDVTVPRLPIGRCAWIKPTADKKGLVAKTIFGEHEWAEEIYRAYQANILRGWSIGFLPEDYSPPKPDEIKKRPEMASVSRVYRRWKLTEYSAVDVPSNPEALAVAVARGFTFSDAVVKALHLDRPSLPPLKSIELPPLNARRLSDVEREIRQGIKAQSSHETAARIVTDAADVALGRV